MGVLRCAVIGCGSVASEYDPENRRTWSLTHAGSYRLCKGTDLVAAADTSLQALVKFGHRWGIRNLYRDYKEMLRTEPLDIVSICLPTEKHYEAFTHACENNIPAIFCEKPLSYNLAEAEKMAQLSGGRVVAVNHFRRWNRTLANLRRDIKGGIHGKVLHVTVHYTKGIFVNGSHMVDLMRWFFGEPDNILFLRTTFHDKKDPGVDFILFFKGNTAVYFLNVPETSYVFLDVDILTSKKRLVIGQRGQTLEIHRIDTEPHYRAFKILKKEARRETEWMTCIPRAVNEIVRCLKNNAETSCPPGDAFRTLKIAYGIANKARRHKP